ncbi:hypothetical protein [Bradyrhizobium sp. CCBAU 45384]|uniref:hypothetical protein n=1 Tax=Bradyrhizobium sp. CCBAU 45384 TaxID=858428 RepID=UPI00230529DE|nr:hypothetical protein [Bradyrhizobium sp. CCBAU 45384]
MSEILFEILSICLLTLGFAAGYATRYLQSRRIRRRLDAATVILQTHGYFLD